MEYNVKIQLTDPDIEPVTIDGVHFILRGKLAWFYRLFRTMDCEEKAIRELWPYLMAEKQKAVSVAKQNTAQLVRANL